MSKAPELGAADFYPRLRDYLAQAGDDEEMAGAACAALGQWLDVDVEPESDFWTLIEEVATQSRERAILEVLKVLGLPTCNSAISATDLAMLEGDAIGARGLDRAIKRGQKNEARLAKRYLETVLPRLAAKKEA